MSPLACSTKDAPGGDACQLQRGHKGPHDWQLPRDCECGHAEANHARIGGCAAKGPATGNHLTAWTCTCTTYRPAR